MNEQDWGQWIDHDGSGCPCKGQLVHFLLGASSSGVTPDCPEAGDWEPGVSPVSNWEGIAVATANPSWFWKSGWFPIIRYRLRKPAALLDLIRQAENPVDPDTAPATPRELVPA